MNKSRMNGLHPLPSALYFLCVVIVTMFTKNPLLIGLSFIGGTVLFPFMSKRGEALKSLAYYLCAILLITVTNPLFSHSGETVLFSVSTLDITAEALLYGLDFAFIFISVLTWCRCGSAVLDGDKIIYLMGKIAPRTAMIISMTLRYIPLFSRQSKRIRRTQTALGIYSSESKKDTMKSEMRVFSSLVGWSLENGVETANSMRARGYGGGRRGSWERYRFSGSDAVFLALTLLFSAAAFTGLLCGGSKFEFYPVISGLPLETADILTYISFAGLAVMPAAAELTERIKWKYYESKI